MDLSVWHCLTRIFLRGVDGKRPVFSQYPRIKTMCIFATMFSSINIVAVIPIVAWASLTTLAGWLSRQAIAAASAFKELIGGLLMTCRADVDV
jgi:hypothetical protein